MGNPYRVGVSSRFERRYDAFSIDGRAILTELGLALDTFDLKFEANAGALQLRSARFIFLVLLRLPSVGSVSFEPVDQRNQALGEVVGVVKHAAGSVNVHGLVVPGRDRVRRETQS